MRETKYALSNEGSHSSTTELKVSKTLTLAALTTSTTVSQSETVALQAALQLGSRVSNPGPSGSGDIELTNLVRPSAGTSNAAASPQQTATPKKETGQTFQTFGRLFTPSAFTITPLPGWTQTVGNGRLKSIFGEKDANFTALRGESTDFTPRNKIVASSDKKEGTSQAVIWPGGFASMDKLSPAIAEELLGAHDSVGVPKPNPVKPHNGEGVRSVADAFRNRAGFDDMMTRLFPGSEESRRQLTDLLLSTHNPAARELPFARPGLLAEALASQPGIDVAGAIRAAKILKSGEFLHSEGPPQCPELDQKNAWEVCQRLAASGGGGVAANALLTADLQDVPQERLEHLRILLIGSAELKKRWQLESGTLAAVENAEKKINDRKIREPAQPKTHYWQGLVPKLRSSTPKAADPGVAVRNGLEAAKKLWRKPGTEADLMLHEKRGYFGLKQDLLSHGTDETLAMVESRLEKATDQWMKRLEANKGLNRPISSIKQVFGKSKSPWSAAVKIGSQGGHLPSVQKVQNDFDTALREAGDKLLTSLKDYMSEPPADDVAARHLATTALNRATLEAWRSWLDTETAASKASKQQHSRPEEKEFNDDDRLNIKARAKELLDSWLGQRQRPYESSARIAQMLKAEILADTMIAKPVTLEWLESAGKENLTRNLGNQTEDRRPPTKEEDFRSETELARGILDNKSLRAASATIEGIKRFTHEIMDNVVSGGSVRLANGGAFGINNARIGIPVAPGVLVGPDPRGTRAQNAVVELSTGAHGLDWFMGKTDQTTFHAGGFVSGGLSHHIAGVNFIMRAGRDDVRTTGVRLRFPRRTDENGKVIQKEGEDGFRRQAKKAADIFFEHAEKKKEGKTDGPTALDELVNFALTTEEGKDTSISFQSHAAVTQRFDVGLTGSLGTAFGGAGASAYYTKILHQAQNRSDRTGQTQRDIYQLGEGRAMTLAGYVGVVSPTAISHADGGGAPINVQGFRSPGVSVTGNDDGRSSSFRATYENGRIVPSLIYRDDEYVNFNKHKEAINKNAEVWHGLMGKENVEAHLIDTQKTMQGNQRFLQRWMGTPELEELIDTFKASAALADPAKPEGAQRIIDLQADMADSFDKGEYWQPLRLFVQENLSKDKTYGFSLLAQLTSSTRVEAVRELRRDGPSTVVSATASRGSNSATRIVVPSEGETQGPTIVANEPMRPISGLTTKAGLGEKGKMPEDYWLRLRKMGDGSGAGDRQQIHPNTIADAHRSLERSGGFGKRVVRSV